MYSAAEDRYDKMPVRRAAHTGFQVPAMSFGMWQSFGPQASYANTEEVVLAAFDHGIFSFDLAANYGSNDGGAEKLFGRVYQENLKAYRDELVITTKAGYHMWPGPYGEMSSRKTLINALDRSLLNMGLDYVDIFYSHRPDDNTDPMETARAMDDIVRAGKALYIGISNYDSAQTQAMIDAFKELHTPFVVNQLSYNMLNRTVETDGTIKTLHDNNAAVVAYGPLAEGLLTGKYLNGIPADFAIHRTNAGLLSHGNEEMVKKLNQLNDLAGNRNQTLAQMATAWLLHNPDVASVVTGASKVDHLLENLKATENTDFSNDELKAIDDIIL